MKSKKKLSVIAACGLIFSISILLAIAGSSQSGTISIKNVTAPSSISSISTTAKSGYNFETSTQAYKAYFKNNTNVAEPVRFEKDGYFMIYDISGGQMLWHEQPGFPARTDTLGSGASSNSEDTQISVSNGVALYSKAFYNTNVTYTVYNNQLKEIFTLYGLPSIKNYTYLEYSGNIKFNSTLDICANGVCYTPSGTQDDFETSGKIEFKHNGITIFYLPAPTIVDSAGHTANAVYSVHGSNAQMNFWLRIPTDFIRNATFPIFIDPTITVNQEVSAVNYQYDGIEVNSTLTRCDVNRQNCGIAYPEVSIVDASKLKFGAIDSGVTNDTNYKYTFTSSTPIKFNGVEYYVETGNLLFGGIGQKFDEIVNINTRDICSALVSNCIFNKTSDYSLDLYFTGDYNETASTMFIDPSYEFGTFDSSAFILNNVTLENNFTHLTVNTTGFWGNLVAYYPFSGDKANGPAGTKIYDFSGSNYDGVTFNHAVVNTTFGLYDRGLGLDGVGDYVIIGGTSTQLIPDASNFTILMWVKPAKASKSAIYGKRSSSSEYWSAYGINYESEGKFSTFVGNSTYWYPNCYQQGSTLALNSWSFIGYTWNGTAMQLYYNGANTVNYTCNVAGLLPNGSKSNYEQIGGAYGGAFNNFNGSIDELMIFNTTLNAADISKIYLNQSSRYFANGTQSNMTFDMNVSSGLLAITDDKETNMGSQLYKRIGEWNGSTWRYGWNRALNSYSGTGWQTFNLFQINKSRTNFTLEYLFVPGTNKFSTPILRTAQTQNVTVQTTSEINRCGIVIDTPGNYNLANNISFDTETTGGAYSECILILSNNVTLDLNGYTIKNGTSTAASGPSSGIKVSSSSNVLIMNGSIDGGYPDSKYLSYGISAYTDIGTATPVKNLTIKNMNIYRWGDEGAISLGSVNLNDYTNNSIIRDNVLHDGGEETALVLIYSNNNLVDNNTIYKIGTSGGAYGDGIGLLDSNNNTVSNNNVSETYEAAIKIWGQAGVGTSDYNTVVNNTLYNCTSNDITGSCDIETPGLQCGCLILRSKNSVVANNKISLSPNWGITVIGTNNTLRDTNMTDIGDIANVVRVTTDVFVSSSLNNTFLNFSYTNESVTSNAQLIRKWYYRAYINETNGKNVTANLTTYNVSNTYQFNLTSDAATGLTPMTTIIDYINTAGTKSYYSLYNLTAQNSSYTPNLLSHTKNVTLLNNIYDDYFTFNSPTPTVVNVTLNTPPDNYVSPTTTVNLTCTATSSAVIKNISLWSNVSGTWQINQTITVGGDLNSGLVGYWSFNEGTGDTSEDLTGKQNNATLVNGPSWTTGKLGNAPYYDPMSSQYAQIPYFAALNTSNFTVNAWVAIYPGDYNSKALSRDDISTQREWSLGINQTSYPLKFVGTTGDEVSGKTVAGGSWTATWTMLTMSYDTSNGLKLYVNGTLVSTATGGGMTGSAVDLLIAKSGTHYMDGQVDEVGFWNRSLNIYEIDGLYNSGNALVYGGVWGNTSTATFSLTISGTTKWSCSACDQTDSCGYAPENRTVSLFAYQTSENSSEWWMFRKYMNHTAWDGKTYTTIPNLNRANYSTGNVYSGPVVANGYVYVNPYFTKVYQLNASNINQHINNFTMSAQGGYSNPIVVNGWLYVGGYDKIMHQINSTTMIEFANFTTTATIHSSPAVANGYLYFSSSALFQLNASNISQQIANYTLSSTSDISPAYANGYIYTADNAYFYQLDATNISKLVNRYNPSISGFTAYSSPLVFNDSVYFGSWGPNKVYQLSASNVSNVLATYSSASSFYSSPAYANGYIYIGGNDKNVYQLSASNVSNLIATFTTGDTVQSSPAVVDGYVYIGSNDKKVYQLNASNISQQIATYTTGGAVYSSPAYANGYIYIGSLDGRTYQLNASNISLSNPDLTAPTFTNNKTNLVPTTLVGSSVYFNITINEENPAVYLFSWYNGTDWENSTWTSYTNGQQVTTTKTINIDIGTINWTWYANDTSGNMGQSEVYSITLTADPTITPPRINNINTTNFTASYMRNDFDQTGLLGWYKLDINSSNQIDSIGKFNATVINATFTNSGKIGTAYSFNGVNTHLNISTDCVPNQTAAFSIFAWVYPTSGSTIQSIAGNLRDTTKDGWQFKLSSTNKLEFQFYAVETVTKRAWGDTAELAVPLNQWSFVGVTFNGTQAIFYINNQSIPKENLTLQVTMLQNAADEVRIGHRVAAGATTERFNGTIDELLMFNRTLTPTEMLNYYSITNPSFLSPMNVSLNVSISDDDTAQTALTYVWSVDGTPVLSGTQKNLLNRIYSNPSTWVTLVVTDDTGLTVTQNWNITTFTLSQGGGVTPPGGGGGQNNNIISNVTQPPAQPQLPPAVEGFWNVWDEAKYFIDWVGYKIYPKNKMVGIWLLILLLILITYLSTRKYKVRDEWL